MTTQSHRQQISTDTAVSDDTIVRADILVVGAGTAGCFAAIAAAQEGAKVIVVEKDHAIGGVGTRAGISSYHYGSRGGLQNTIDKNVIARQKVLGGKHGLFHPEAKHSVLSEWMTKLQIEVLLNSFVYEVIVSEQVITGVKVCSDDGLREIQADIVIDSTADGDISAMAGADYITGRDFDGIYHHYSLAPRVVNLNRKTGKKEISVMNFDAGWVDSLDMKDVSLAYMEGREHLLSYYNEGAPPALDMIAIAPQLGIREGRHIIGDYVMNLEDFLYDKRFDDVVLRSCSHYDTHARDLGNESDFAQIWLVVLDMFVKFRFWCDVPYRSLLAKGIDNLYVASRALSVNREVSLGVRMQRDIHKVGEAAGVAAAMSVAEKVKPRELHIPQLQQKLMARGVLSKEDLERQTTTNLSFEQGALADQHLGIDWMLNLSLDERRQMMEHLISYIGSDEEGKALWWMMQIGKDCSEPLLQLMNHGATHHERRSAAFGLALLRKPESIPFLLEILTGREDNSASKVNVNHKSNPKWVSAVVLLRLMDRLEAFPEVLKALHENHSASINTFLLQYLYQAADKLAPGEQARLIQELKEWIRQPDVGEDYVAQGDRVVVSLRWNLTCWVAMILAKLGDEAGISLCEEYLEDQRVYIRNAAVSILDRVKSELQASRLKGSEQD